MQNRFQLYPKYKDSGVEWLGEVPDGWGVAPLKRLAKTQLSNVDKRSIEGERPVKLCNYVDVYKNERITARIEFMPASASDEQIRRLSIRRGDVLITKDSETPDDIGVPALVAEDLGCVVCGYHLALLRPYDGISIGGYLARLLTSGYVRAQFATLAVGMTRYGLGKYDIENVLLPVPSTPEQTAIGSFLDRESARIDALIAEQQRLIALLKEKRQALISHAVTKGLDPAVKMKDSGVEWLGEVPEHWEVKRLKFLGQAIIGLTYDPSDVVDKDNGILVLRSSNVQGGKIVFDDNIFVRKTVPENILTKLGDILICSRNGSRALIGKNAIINDDSIGLTFGAFMTIFRSKHNLYLSYVFNSSLFEFQSGSFLTSTVNQLTTSNLYGFEVPVPPNEEQFEIVTFLDRETTRIDTLIQEVERAIELLKEHRQSLISAAVTGKIDVREESTPRKEVPV